MANATPAADALSKDHVDAIDCTEAALCSHWLDLWHDKQFIDLAVVAQREDKVCCVQQKLTVGIDARSMVTKEVKETATSTRSCGRRDWKTESGLVGAQDNATPAQMPIFDGRAISRVLQNMATKWRSALEAASGCHPWRCPLGSN